MAPGKMGLSTFGHQMFATKWKWEGDASRSGLGLRRVSISWPKVAVLPRKGFQHLQMSDRTHEGNLVVTFLAAMEQMRLLRARLSLSPERNDRSGCHDFGPRSATGRSSECSPAGNSSFGADKISNLRH